MTDDTLGMDDAAAVLGIAPASLRRWADDAAPILPDFRPDLAPRRFSEADITALASLLALARQHPRSSRAQLVDRVRSGDLTPPLVTLTARRAVEARPPARRSTADFAALEALTAQVAALQTAIEALTAKLDTLTASPPMIEPPPPTAPPSFWQRLRAWFTGKE